MNEQDLRAIADLLDKKLQPIHERLHDIDKKIDLLSMEKPEDVTAMLHIMNGKLDSIKKDVEFTYQKASMNELEIHRLKSQ